MSVTLPPGHQVRKDMPPFGLPWYAHRVPPTTPETSVRVGGHVESPFFITAAELADLPRTTQVSDFHCVTMWSRSAVSWSGYRFVDVYERLIRPHALDSCTIERVRFRGADGYRDELPLSDLLAEDVLLADTLDGRLLPRANGAPLRLVAPAHYGYKNVKYLTGIELLGPARRLPLITLHHPRARHAYEERLPYPVSQRAVGHFYRITLRRPTRWWFRRMLSR